MAESKKSPDPLKKYTLAANTMRIIGEPIRIRIVMALADSDWSGVQLRDGLDLSYQTLTKHIALCRHTDIVEHVRSGGKSIYQLTEKGKMLAGIIREVFRWQDR